MEQVRIGDCHFGYSRDLGHREDQNMPSFPEDLDVNGKLSSGTMGRRSPVSKTETQALSKTVIPNLPNY